MTNLFICKRTIGGNSTSEYGTRYYIYEELAPVEDLERVREALQRCLLYMSGNPAINYKQYDDVSNQGQEAIKILDKIK